MSHWFSPLLPESVGSTYVLTADAGTFSLSGQFATLPLIAGTGTFTLTGIPLGTPSLIASVGVFSLAMQNVGRAPLEAEVGEFSLAGQDATLPTYRIFCEPGKFLLSGRLFNQPLTPSSTLKIVTLGDSIMEFANGNTSAIRIDNQADGEIHWVKARGKAGFRHDVYYDPTAIWLTPASKPFFNGANQGHAGDWAKGVERRLTAVFNMNPDVVVLNIGTNFGPPEDGPNATQTIATIASIVSQLAGVNQRDGNGIIRLVIGTIRPRAVTAAPSGLFSIEIRPADRVRIETINAYIRTLDNDSTIFVWDPEPDLLDPNPSAPLLAGSCYRWVVRDGVHLAPRGAFESSRSLELTLDRILKDGTWFNSDPTVSNAVTNGALTGTSGTAGTGTSGDVPDNFTLFNVSGASSIITAVSTAASGNWQIAVSSVGGSSSSSNSQVVRGYSSAIDVAAQGWTSTTWVKMFVEVAVSGTQVLGALHADLVNGAGNNSNVLLSQAIGPTLQNRATEDFAHEPWSGWLETTAQQVGSATALAARIDIEPLINRAGDTVVTIKKVIVREVDNPRTLFPFDPLDPSIYALSGQDVTFNLVGVQRLTADHGTFALTGQAANTLYARRPQMDNGRFVALGNGGVPLVDEQGAYLIDEQGAVLFVEEEPVSILVSRMLTAEAGVFALAGQEVAFALQEVGSYVITAENALFGLVGHDANVHAALITQFDSGSFSIDAPEVLFAKTIVALTADAGIFEIAWQTAAPQRSIVPDFAAFIFSGLDADLSVTRRRTEVRFGPLLRLPGKLYPVATVTINGTFNDEDGLPFDPVTVKFLLVSPSGRETSYTHGSNSEVIRYGDGRYRVDATLDEPGRWHYQWRVTVLDVTSIKEGDLLVQDTPFYSGARRSYG